MCCAAGVSMLTASAGLESWQFHSSLKVSREEILFQIFSLLNCKSQPGLRGSVLSQFGLQLFRLQSCLQGSYHCQQPLWLQSKITTEAGCCPDDMLPSNLYLCCFICCTFNFNRDLKQKGSASRFFSLDVVRLSRTSCD